MLPRLLVVGLCSGFAIALAPCTLKFSPNAVTIHEVQLAVRDHLATVGGRDEEVGKKNMSL